MTLRLAVSLSVDASLHRDGTWDLVVPLLVGGLSASVIYAAVFVPWGFFTDRAVPEDLADTPMELAGLSTAVLWTAVAAVVSVALVALVLRNRDLTSE